MEILNKVIDTYGKRCYNIENEIGIIKESEADDMEVVLDERKEYRRLDMSKIKFSDEPISMEESLKDIIPINWSDDVLSGKKKVIISKQK